MKYDLVIYLQQPECLVHAPPDGEIIDGDLLDHALGIDDEESPVGNAELLDQDAIAGTQLLGHIRKDGDLRGFPSQGMTGFRYEWGIKNRI